MLWEHSTRDRNKAKCPQPHPGPPTSSWPRAKEDKASVPTKQGPDLASLPPAEAGADALGEANSFNSQTQSNLQAPLALLRFGALSGTGLQALSLGTPACGCANPRSWLILFGDEEAGRTCQGIRRPWSGQLHLLKLQQSRTPSLIVHCLSFPSL